MGALGNASNSSSHSEQTYFSRFLKKANSAALLQAGQMRLDAI
jgi:hypothetical protein